MDVSVIFVVIAVIFVGLTFWSRRDDGGPFSVQQRIWLAMAGIFALVGIALRLVG